MYDLNRTIRYLQNYLDCNKSIIQKIKPRNFNYHKYEFYDNNTFLSKLNHVNISKQDNSLKVYHETCLAVFKQLSR